MAAIHDEGLKAELRRHINRSNEEDKIVKGEVDYAVFNFKKSWRQKFDPTVFGIEDIDYLVTLVKLHFLERAGMDGERARRIAAHSTPRRHHGRSELENLNGMEKFPTLFRESLSLSDFMNIVKKYEETHE